MAKKPSADMFSQIVEKCGGNLTNVAKALDVSRKTIWQWCEHDQRFKDAVEEQKMRIFDKCLSTAQAVCLGIPDYQIIVDPVTGTETKRMVGWIERPDSNMLRYMLGQLGKAEGFGEHLDITSNGKTVGQAKPIKIMVVHSKEELAKLKAEDEKNHRTTY